MTGLTCVIRIGKIPSAAVSSTSPIPMAALSPRTSRLMITVSKTSGAVRTEHRPVIFRLWCRDGSVRVAHDCRCDRAALQNHVWLYAEEHRIPDTEVGKLSNFNGADVS